VYHNDFNAVMTGAILGQPLKSNLGINLRSNIIECIPLSLIMLILSIYLAS